MYSRLNRHKLDPNRGISEATLNVPDAIRAYRDYTKFIEKARSVIRGRGLLLDIHGHAHKLPRTELGYLIHKNSLVRGEYSVKETSIRSLVQHWCGRNDDSCFKDFITGNRSLGHFMSQEGLQAVPSPQNKTPAGETYLNGGCTVVKYGSRDKGNIDAIQMELPKELRFGWGRHSKNRLARAISKFFKLNY